MRNLLCTLMILTFLFSSCKKENEQEYVFIKEHCARLTVGGVVGVAERCFQIGETVKAIKKTNDMITIRIAAHSSLNDGPPSNMSYQEFLEVPLTVLGAK